METIEKTGVFGTFEPTCKIRFLEEPNKDEEYIAVTPAYLADLIYDSMKLTALESGGVDNWEWYGESISEYMKELPQCYGQKFYDWVAQEKTADETFDDYIDDMSLRDYAEYEVYVM